MIWTEDEKKVIDDMEDEIHASIEDVMAESLEPPAFLIARVTVLCPTCKERDRCDVRGMWKRKYRKICDELIMARRESKSMVVSGSSGIEVPMNMIDMERES